MKDVAARSPLCEVWNMDEIDVLKLKSKARPLQNNVAAYVRFHVIYIHSLRYFVFLYHTYVKLRISKYRYFLWTTFFQTESMI